MSKQPIFLKLGINYPKYKTRRQRVEAWFDEPLWWRYPRSAWIALALAVGTGINVIILYIIK